MFMSHQLTTKFKPGDPKALEAILQGRPRLARRVLEARSLFGSRNLGPLAEHGIDIMVGCASYGVFDPDKANADPKSTDARAVDTALYHPLHGKEFPHSLSPESLRALRFFDTLRDIDDSKEWKRYERAVSAHDDQLIALFVRMVDLLVSVHFDDLTWGHMEDLRRIRGQEGHYVGPEKMDLIKHMYATAAGVFYAPFADYVDMDLYRDLINMSASILHPEEYALISGLIAERQERIDATLGLLRELIPGQLAAEIDARTAGAGIVDWDVRQKAIGSIVFKLKRKYGLTDIDEHSAAKLLDSEITDLAGAKIIIEGGNGDLYTSLGLLEMLLHHVASRSALRDNLHVDLDQGGQPELIVKLVPVDLLQYVTFEGQLRTPGMDFEYYVGIHGLDGNAHPAYKSRAISGDLSAPVSRAVVKATRNYLSRLKGVNPHADNAIWLASDAKRSAMKIDVVVSHGRGKASRRRINLPPGSTVADLLVSTIDLGSNAAVVTAVNNGNERRVRFRDVLDPTCGYVVTLLTPGFSPTTLTELYSEAQTAAAREKIATILPANGDGYSNGHRPSGRASRHDGKKKHTHHRPAGMGTRSH